MPRWLPLLALVLFIVLGIFLYGTRNAHAATLYEQTDRSVSSSTLENNNDDALWDIPAGTNGVLESAETWGMWSGSGTPHHAQFFLYIQCFTDAARTSSCDSSEWGTVQIGSIWSDRAGATPYLNGTRQFWDDSAGGVATTSYFELIPDEVGTTTMRANRFYRVEIQRTHTSYIYGDASGEPYLVLTGASASSFDTEIRDILSPGNGATTPGTTVNVDFTYWFNDVADFGSIDVAGVEMTKITNGAQEIASIEETINASGLSEYSENYGPLTQGSEYAFRPYLRGTTSGRRIYGPLQYFYVVNADIYPIDLNTLTASSSVASSTTGLVGIFENLRDTVENNPPFGFIFQVKSELEDLSASSTPATSLWIMDWVRDNVLTPLDGLLAAIVGLLFIRWGLKRFSHIEL